MSSKEKAPLRLPAGMLSWLTTRCLTAALALQALGISTTALNALLLPGVMLAVVGLGASACARSARIENGWAFLGLLPIVGLFIGYAVLHFRQAKPNAPLNALRGAAHAGLLGAILVGVGMLMWFSTQRGHELHGEVPDYFPILAVVADDRGSSAAHIVPMRDFEAFVGKHPDVSFLVPRHLEESLHANLHSGFDEPFQPASFEVRELAGGRQAFKVRFPIHSEAYSVGWYEASTQGIEPKRYLMFHDMMLGFIGFPILLIAAIVYSLSAWVLNRWIWPRFALPDDSAHAGTR